MTEEQAHHNRRGHGPLRDTWNTLLEAVDGCLMAAATMSDWLWRERVARVGLGPELPTSFPPSMGRRPRLWRERSVRVELAVILMFLVIGHMRGMVLIWPLAVAIFAGFLVTESVNAVVEWLVDAYQLSVKRALEPDIYVRLIKHAASACTLALNIVGVLGWILLMIWPHTHIVVMR